MYPNFELQPATDQEEIELTTTDRGRIAAFGSTPAWRNGPLVDSTRRPPSHRPRTVNSTLPSVRSSVTAAIVLRNASRFTFEVQLAFLNARQRGRGRAHVASASRYALTALVARFAPTSRVSRADSAVPYSPGVFNAGCMMPASVEPFGMTVERDLPSMP